ncbi:MAG TPA: glycosyltransferase family 4 protein [Armatimonadota bacterium]|jgi:glycosyltransferase involved in cell wall biosynthesis
MTIIQVMHSHTIGGVERHVVSLGEALMDRGHQVYLACPNRGWMWDAVQGTRVKPFHLAMDGLLDVTSVGRLGRLARMTHADIIHSHMTRGTFYAVKAGHRLGIPVIASCHATHTYKYYAGADRVICVSDAARQNLLRHGVPDGLLRTVHNGIEIPACGTPEGRVAALRAEWGVVPGGKVVGMLARLIPDKGIDILLQVAAKWKLERPNVTFVLAGSGDDDTELKLRSFVERHNLDGSVKFLGTVPNAYEVLGAYDVLAAPSRRESFSLTLLEAMAARTPVVASRVGGTPEMVTHGETGILVEPDSPESLGAGLASALDGPEVCRYVEAADKMVRERFTVKRMVDDIETQYRELLKG